MRGEDDAQSHNPLSRKAKSGGLRFLVGYQEEEEVGNKHSEVEAHSNDLASYSESNNDSLCPDHSHNNNCNLYGLERNMSIGNETKTPIDSSSTGYKPSKRKAEESKNLLVVQSERNTVQDPRIVRVNRASGGKDRHSKVRTSKGLRDRRVRLSVSTAIQFYDLQDRLGFEQPSKAVDWLINKAKSAIDELPVLETDTAGAVCNLSQTLASSNCSPANVSAAAAPGVFAAALGVSSAESAQFSQKGEETASAAQILNQVSAAFRQSDVGRFSSSSTSDGSIKGGDTSHSSLSKYATGTKTRLKEARERAKRKSASAKGSGPHPQQLNQMRTTFAELLNNPVCYSTQLPAQDKPQCSPGDHHNHNSYGLPNQISSSSNNIQQPWNTVSSYTDILCQDAVDQRDHQQQLNLMASFCSSSHAAIEQSSPPSSSVAAIGTTYLRRYNEMGNSGIQLFNTPNLKQRHHQLGGNGAQFQTINLYSDPVRSFVKNNMLESQELQQHQHGSQTVQKQFASTFNVPAFSNDVNFSTSCLSSRGALQSNSSSVQPDTPSLHINPKNAYGDASTQLHFDVPPGETHHFQGFEAQFPERFQQGFNFEGESTKHEQSYISAPRRR